MRHHPYCIPDLFDATCLQGCPEIVHIDPGFAADNGNEACMETLHDSARLTLRTRRINETNTRSSDLSKFYTLRINPPDGMYVRGFIKLLIECLHKIFLFLYGTTNS